MRSLRSILVVVDPDQPDGPALDRARLIANHNHAHLHLLICEQRGDHSERLQTCIASLREQGYSASGRQAWNDSLQQTISGEQQSEGCELVIKQHSPDNPLKKALLTPGDWKVLREVAAPVLLVKQARQWAGHSILAAVDVGNLDSEHQALHSSILDYARAIAEITQGPLHVLSAHPSPMLSAADPTFQLSQTLSAQYRVACDEFQQRHGLTNEQLHVEEGAADALIPALALRLEAAVTVIGSVARSGLSGALIGNTAEVVLDALESDVLVLKPDTAT
ncbi:MAG: Universal stress protein E [Pseudomonas citronellolis]|nr:MAG: Universal stress protein E [Pseudomonas citronellolis]